MVMRRMESKDIAANHVSGKVVKIQHQTDIQKNAVKRLSEHNKSVVVYEGWQEHLK